MHYLGDLDFFRPGAEPLIDAMHAFFRFMDSITKMLLKSIRAFMKSCRWGFGAKAEKISRLSVFRDHLLVFGATIGPALRNKDVLVIKRLSSHIFNSVLYDSDWGLPFDAMRSRKDTIGIPPDFCKFEAAEQKGWRNLQKYVKALHFAMFVSRNPADDMGFTSHAEASDWVRLSTQKMMDLAEHMVPRMQIFPKHGPPRQYNVFGTRSCTSLACILPKQFAAGMHGSVFSTDKMENMQSIPRIGASQTVRGATQYGKSAILEIMRDQDRRTEMDRKGSKAVEREAAPKREEVRKATAAH